jgi:hypothetical protein
MTDQLKRFQHLIQKWEKHLPTCAQQAFNGHTGVVKGQRYAYKRMLREIEALLREENAEHDYGELREMSAIQG